jgi:hypothetical protein
MCQAAADPDANELRWPATIVDISQGGVRIHLRRRFERGAPLAIELPGSRRAEASIVFVKVIHIRPLPDGSWAHGCQFISELSEEEVERLVAPTQREEMQPLSSVMFGGHASSGLR